MDAYTYLKENKPIQALDQAGFDALAVYFRKAFLDEKDYAAKLATHRQPAEFSEQLLGGGGYIEEMALNVMKTLLADPARIHPMIRK